MKITNEEHMSILDEIAADLTPPEGSFNVAEFMQEKGIPKSQVTTIRRRFKKAVEENKMIYHGRFTYEQGSSGYYSVV